MFDLINDLGNSVPLGNTFFKVVTTFVYLIGGLRHSKWFFLQSLKRVMHVRWEGIFWEVKLRVVSVGNGKLQ